MLNPHQIRLLAKAARDIAKIQREAAEAEAISLLAIVSMIALAGIALIPING